MTESKASGSSQRLGAAALNLLSDHAELFAIELQEQKRHSSQQLIWAGVAAACAFMLFLLLNGLLIALLWSRFDYWLLVAMSVFYAVAALLCVWRIQTAQKNAAAPFSASLQELKNTKEQLLP